MSNLQENNQIDENLYSRQLYVLGHEAMKKMQHSNILICGMGGLGVEIAKNTILAGVKSVTIHDRQNVSWKDLSTQYFLSEDLIGKNRAECSLKSLSELNSYVKVHAHTQELDKEFLKQFQVVVLTESSCEQQLDFGNFCHQEGIKFIVADTRGVFGKIFCDFGEGFCVFDVNGQNKKTAMISYITNDEDGIVTTFEDQRHDLEDGDYVTFSEVKGMTELNNKEFKIKVLGPFSFSIGDTSKFQKYALGGIMTEVKKEKIINFKPIELAVVDPVYCGDDLKYADYNSIHLAFQVLDHFKQASSGDLPRSWDLNDANNFVEMVKSLNSKRKIRFDDLNEELLKTFSAVCRGNLCPVQSVIGGMAAQEIMKACSGKFHPIVQYFYYDCREVLPENGFETLGKNTLDSNNRYASQVAVFGTDFQEKLENYKCFLVGSGALGCEYLKNFAMMGISCGENGHLTITDMDTIEKSNLNRQFLFRSWDVNQSKAVVSSNAARRMNPNMRITANLNRVGPDTEEIYNDQFFNSLDVICNALDNVKTRLYIDSKSIEFHKPLIESGTLGTEGNVQVCVPHLTEAYSSSQDPPEKNIPICTLKIFPNAIEHTLQWARDKFEGLFSNSVISAVNFIKDSVSFFDSFNKFSFQQKLDELQQLEKILIKEKCDNFEQCVHWAKNLFQESFHNIIKQLLFNFPPEHKATNGLPFWSGPKRCPHPVEFDPNNSLHLDFIYSAANLKAFVHGLEQVRDRSLVFDLVRDVQVDEFRPKTGIKIKVNESDEDSNDNTDEDELEMERLTELLQEFYNNLNKNSIKLIPAEFEKDDDTNFHMDFITACSNLRAENYDIAPTDKHNSKLIAGKIIPAIATTTSVVVGLDCIELYKLIQGHGKLELFRNSYINLALPFFQSSEPMPVMKNSYNGIEWSLWDRIEIKGEITLQQFLDHFKSIELKVSMITHDVVTIYSEFLSSEKIKDRMHKKITEIREIVKKEKLPDHIRSLTLTVACYNLSDEDVEIPLVKYTL